METVKEVLMKRDNLSPEEADEVIKEFMEDLDGLVHLNSGTYDQACELVQEYFGLEPEYLEEFLI